MSGPVSTWADSCPVEGVCTECGLAFAWTVVMRPHRHELPWLFEHARRLLWLRFIGTALRSLFPWRFWKQVRLEHRLVGRRLAWYGALVAVLFYAVAVGMLWAAPDVSSMLTTPASMWSIPYFSYRLTFWQLIMPFGWEGAFWDWGMMSSAYTSCAIGMTLATPLLFPIVRFSLRQSKVRPMHIVRGGVYSLTGSAVIAVVGWILGFAAQVLEANAWNMPGLRSIWEVVYWWQDREPVVWFWMAWLLLSWWMFCRRYLKLRHAFFVALALLVIAGMLPVVVLVVGFGIDLYWWIPTEWLV